MDAAFIPNAPKSIIEDASIQTCSVRLIRSKNTECSQQGDIQAFHERIPIRKATAPKPPRTANKA